MIAERVGATLSEHGITLDEGPHVPGYFSGAELAIVAAHGSLVPERTYFSSFRTTPG
jgi:hypothetical protein